MQRVDTVFAVAGLVFRRVVVCLSDVLVAEVIHAVPTEVVAFADRQGLFEMVFIHVLRQDQAPKFATSRCLVRELKLICTRSVVLYRLGLTCRTVRPGVFVLSQSRSGLVDALWMLVDDDFHHRVATQIVKETAALGIRLTVEDHLFVIADGEGRVSTRDLADSKMQTIVVV